MRGRSLRSGGMVVALLAAVGLAACSSGGDGAGADVFTNESAGISLTVPVGWHATTRRFTRLLDPRERVTLTSFPVDNGRSRRCSPDFPLRQMPRTGVFAWLLEYVDASARRRVDRRPQRFRLDEPTQGSFECFPLPQSRPAEYLFNFGDRGRAFQLFVLVGKDASRATRLATAQALDSIQIEPCDRPLPTEVKPLCRRPLPH